MKPGDQVSKGQLLMTVEGMKMEVSAENLAIGMISIIYRCSLATF